MQNEDTHGLLHGEITQEILGSAFEVHRVLGYGFLEKVYQRAMMVELSRRGLKSSSESEIRVQYKGIEVGYYKADLLVEGVVVVEIKVASSYNSLDEAQLHNELKATGLRVGLLINFGRYKVEYKQFAM